MTDTSSSPSGTTVRGVEDAVISRYADGAKAREEALCCPVTFDPKHLAVLPQEIIDRDYGCGDPTPYVRPGDTVLDLGSGAGKVCWIAAQIAGPQGRVIGVDMNTDMLALARQHHAAIAAKVGFDTVTYRRGMIQDLALDLDALEGELQKAPVSGAEGWLALRQLEERLRSEQTMIADGSVDVVLSNCVLNLVRPEDKQAMFDEIFRVVKPGGRVAISDIVADEDVPMAMQQDPELWSGCISGAYREDLFLEAFAKAGFYGIEIVKRDAQPWQTVQGIEFRAVTVQAFKGQAGPSKEYNEAVIYRGPFSKAWDDDGQVYVRGQRTAVGHKTHQMLMSAPYAGMFESVPPRVAVNGCKAGVFARPAGALRHPKETKGADYTASDDGASSAGSCC